MSEQTPLAEQQMVRVLQPRFELSPRTREHILSFMEPSGGQPALLGIYATRTIMLDADAYQRGVYTRSLIPQVRAFESARTHIHFGIARTSRNRLLKIPPSIAFSDKGEGNVRVALRPRSTSPDHFENLVRSFTFDEYEDDEVLRPYADRMAASGDNYLYLEVAHAALRKESAQHQRATAIREFTEAAADLGNTGQDYYATPLELSTREMVAYVKPRAHHVSRQVFETGYDDTPDGA